MCLETKKIKKGEYLLTKREKQFSVRKVFSGWDVYLLKNGTKVLVKNVKKLSEAKDAVIDKDEFLPETIKYGKSIKSAIKRKLTKIFGKDLKFKNHTRRKKRGVLYTSAPVNKSTLHKLEKFVLNTDNWAFDACETGSTFFNKKELFVIKLTPNNELEIMLNFYALSS